MSNEIDLSNIKLPNLSKYLLILIPLLLILPSAFVIVDAGKVGVVKKLGAVQPIPMEEGFHLKVPFIDQVVEMNIRLNNSRSEALSSSKDLQTVKTVVSVQYSITGAMAAKTFQKVGRKHQIQATVIEPAISESVKSVTAKYTAEELITKRETVKLKIQKAIQLFIDTTLNEKGITNGIKIANVAITDFNFSPEFNRAIELKVKAEQEALQAKNEKLRRVTQAEAAAEEKKLSAQANAYEIEVGSKARADAIKRESRALKSNPELIQLRIAEKWDGQLPQFNGGSMMPLLNIDNMKKGITKK